MPIFHMVLFSVFISLSLILPFGFSQSPQQVLSNPDWPHSNRIPTVHESAVQARRILNLSSIATISTVFPDNGHPSSLEDRPGGLGGVPIGLMEYYASCDPVPYEPTILAVSIATSIKNWRAGSQVSLSLRYHPPADHPPGEDMYTYSPANLPRFSLIGHIEPIPRSIVRKHGIATCFLDRHPDAEIWTPGNDIHESWWGKLVVEQIYWFGGFGDRVSQSVGLELS